MDSKEYIKQAIRTESDKFTGIHNYRLLHGAMGIVTEAGELMDAMKKVMFYKRELDRINLIEELGDLFWYVALMCDELGVSFDEVMQKNIAKLMARYPEKFTVEDEQNRKLGVERGVLEGYGL